MEIFLQKLGKAKRMRLERQARAGQPTTVNTPNGPIPARHAGFTYTEAQREAATWQQRGGDRSVPCNGCNACCYGERIEVNTAEEPADHLAHMDLVPDQYGDMKMRRRETDGGCVHLVDNGGCTIYQYRPKTCREYDCRFGALYGIRRAHATPNGQLDQPLWVFDVETPTDKIEHVTSQAVCEFLQETGVPDDPAALGAMIKAAYQALKPLVEKIANDV